MKTSIRHFCGRIAAAGALMVAASCAGRGAPAPPPTAPRPVPEVSIEQKVAWLLRLEQQRLLRDAGAASVPAGTAVRTFVPARTPDLEALAVDPDEHVRRRALLALGRVGLAEGVPAVAAALAIDARSVRRKRGSVTIDSSCSRRATALRWSP